ncbi:hypothetical protein D1007_52322 [Hordeum vulgare]|nr:hypothetical protein D1007_52322 [Hordeum vulgare]
MGLSVVYINNPVWVEHYIHIMEMLLAEEKYKNASIACQNLVDIQGQYNIWGSKKHEKDSLVHLTDAKIDPYYRYMKDSCNKDTHAWHSSWTEKLDKAHVVYVAKEAYMSYEMYRRMFDIRKSLLPQNC